ncbi:MAG: hypothetical protein K8S15_05370 [Candidatus Aegiribacteria sp.]|nr:hypothetical protein [Candidatus Aegiribacteria sp.]
MFTIIEPVNSRHETGDKKVAGSYMNIGTLPARKGGGFSGTITLWINWKRLADLSDGWGLGDSG